MFCIYINIREYKEWIFTNWFGMVEHAQKFKFSMHCHSKWAIPLTHFMLQISCFQWIKRPVRDHSFSTFANVSEKTSISYPLIRTRTFAKWMNLNMKWVIKNSKTVVVFNSETFQIQFLVDALSILIALAIPLF